MSNDNDCRIPCGYDTSPYLPRRNHFETIVAKEAYSMWEHEGRPIGRELAHWYAAVALVRARASVLPQIPASIDPVHGEQHIKCYTDGTLWLCIHFKSNRHDQQLIPDTCQRTGTPSLHCIVLCRAALSILQEHDQNQCWAFILTQLPAKGQTRPRMPQAQRRRSSQPVALRPTSLLSNKANSMGNCSKRAHQDMRI